ncbi:hypothetical protein PCANC_16984 [Puccinia coronata f. sp. avenae]|uniref:Uncharacterized protein n=1 Tax=Puccinia coronata f. sp. avenae TaxID=200324 RepID=A0A2N5SLT5_9BASI|nr:hypothetical protein PCANC_16982 [Puccinia coronata f. sp. avenae]PLW14174.1 hypothetical protein PCANC_16984 [Puccinia coronata f. sp. avenae]
MEVQSLSDGAVFLFDGRVLGSFDARLVEDRRRSRPATQARANLNPSRRSDRGDALQPSEVPGLIRAYSSKGQGLPTKQRPGPNQIKLRSALRHAQGDQDAESKRSTGDRIPPDSPYRLHLPNPYFPKGWMLSPNQEKSLIPPPHWEIKPSSRATRRP